MSTLNRAEVTRSKILNAAADLIGTHGANHLTLEEVARLAGVSKGGLLYHFPSKEALLTAMVERMHEEQRAMYDSLLTGGVGPLEAFIHIFERTKLNPQNGIKIDAEQMIAFLTLFDLNPDYAKQWKQELETFYQTLLQTSDPVEAMIIRYALEGMMMSEHFELGLAPTEVKRDILKRLTERAIAIDVETKRQRN